MRAFREAIAARGGRLAEDEIMREIKQAQDDPKYATFLLNTTDVFRVGDALRGIVREIKKGL